jgi:hypothetical protein
MDSSLSLAEQPGKPNADIMPAKPALHRMRLAAAMLFAAAHFVCFWPKADIRCAAMNVRFRV